MTALSIAVVLQASIVAATTDSYVDAHRETIQTGKPIVVMVGASWCGPCQTMKKEVLPQVRKKGTLKKVSFAVVDSDREARLARKLIGSGSVPQLLMFRRTRGGWRRRKLLGCQDAKSVEKFIEDGLTLDSRSKAETKQQRRSSADRDGDRAHAADGKG
jgi:thioredoxin-like negative regulator of GroEL